MRPLLVQEPNEWPTRTTDVTGRGEVLENPTLTDLTRDERMAISMGSWASKPEGLLGAI